MKKLLLIIFTFVGTLHSAERPRIEEYRKLVDATLMRFNMELKKLDSELEVNTKDARSLILRTAITESGLKYRVGFTCKSDLGLIQMNKATHKDLYKTYLHRKDNGRVLLAINNMFGEKTQYQKLNDLKYHDAYGIVMARVRYMRVKGELPRTLEGQAHYWKKYYNTYLGAGKVSHFITKSKY